MSPLQPFKMIPPKSSAGTSGALGHACQPAAFERKQSYFDTFLAPSSVVYGINHSSMYMYGRTIYAKGERREPHAAANRAVGRSVTPSFCASRLWRRLFGEFLYWFSLVKRAATKTSCVAFFLRFAFSSTPYTLAVSCEYPSDHVL